jgi:hypothetical protein
VDEICEAECFEVVRMELRRLNDCRFRCGIAKKGRVMFYCKFAPYEHFDISEMSEICTEFCPLKFRKLYIL